jgi:ribulose-5-phosphate 4-epimerase/fuculose-1-phosphate aldolase
MKVIDDGVIKYDRSNFTYCDRISEIECRDLEYQRKKLYHENLIGECPIHKVGFGNISVKYDLQQYHSTTNPQFIITGTQTGKFSELNSTQYTRVIDFDIENLKLHSMGALEASSEALTHAAIYLSNPQIGGIVHVHSSSIWNGIITNTQFTTSKNIPYGTKEMAHAVMAFSKNHHTGYFAMEGHEDGVVAFAPTIEEATVITLQLHHQYSLR